MPGIEPEAAGWEARMLPLCSAAPLGLTEVCCDGRVVSLVAQIKEILASIPAAFSLIQP